GADLAAPAPFDASRTLGNALLTPTRIYVRPLLAVLRQFTDILALAHITGGGLTENLPRVLPRGVTARIDLESLPGAPVFGWLKNAGNIATPEMLRTFNCGIGMVLVVKPEVAEQVAQALTDQGEEPVMIGELTPAKSDDAKPVVDYSGTPAWAS
ncbi:MAG: AIR synthase-related protein, partial [Hyphomicrobiales bacterium]